jgi:GNAT superfamily N-acetyltransferase
MDIYKCEKQDLIRVQKIAQLTWADTYKDILSVDQLDFMLEWMYNLETLLKQMVEGHQFHILIKEGVDVGFIGTQNNYPAVGETKLHKIYVQPLLQGTGAGRTLMEKAESLARENQSDFFVLNVNRFNKAKDFYIKLGFEISYEEDIDIGNGFLMEDYVMKKRLSEPL